MVIQTALWCSLFGCVGIFAKEEIKKRKNAKGTSEKEVLEERIDRTPHYTQLFTNLGLMNSDKGDWIKCLDVIYHKNYRLVKFRISDSLSCEDFKSKLERIKEKMQVKHLEIYNDKGIMFFRVRNDVIELVPYEFKRTKKHLIPLGLDIEDGVIYWNLISDPHTLICGTTGSGKSRLLGAVINHLYYNNDAKLYMIDLKRGMEFGVYKNTNNVVKYAEVLDDVSNVIRAFDDEQERRYKILKDAGYSDYTEYIKDHPSSNLKRAFLIIDEVADIQRLNKKGKDEYNVMDDIIEIGCKCRCCGMHIICATQKATNAFISSDLKVNMSCIIGMKARDKHNSRLILDCDGLEELNQAEAIGNIENKHVFFRAFSFDKSITKETAAKFASDTPKEKKEEVENKKKSGIK